MMQQSRFEDLAYWKNNAEENYMTTPISVLKYITKLENHIETIKAQLPSDEEIKQEAERLYPLTGDVSIDSRNHLRKKGFIDGMEWMRDKIQGGNK